MMRIAAIYGLFFSMPGTVKNTALNYLDIPTQFQGTRGAESLGSWLISSHRWATLGLRRMPGGLMPAASVAPPGDPGHMLFCYTCGYILLIQLSL